MEDINTKEGGKVEKPWGKSLMVSSKDYQVDAANSCVYMKIEPDDKKAYERLRADISQKIRRNAGFYRLCGLQGFCFYTYEIGNQESLILCLTFNVCKNDEKNLEESFLFFYEVINKVVLNQQTNVYNLIPDKLDQNGITTFTISDPKYCTEKKYGQIAQALYEIFKDISGFSLRRSYGKFIIEYPDDIQTQLLYRENIRSIIRKKLLASDFSKRRPLCDNLKAVSDLLSGVQKVKSCDHACLDEFLFWKKESQNSKTVVGNPTFSTSSLSFFNSSSSSGNPDGKSPKLDIKTLLNPS